MKKTRIALINAYKKEFIIGEELGISYITAVLREKGFEVLLMGVMEGQVDYNSIYGFKPDVIGFPVYTSAKDLVYEISSNVKKELPNIHVVLGGFVPTYHSREVLNEAPFVDSCCRGEGEMVILDLCNRIEENMSLDGCKGLTFRGKNGIVVNKDQNLIADLDTLPFPSRDLLKNNGLKYAYISTSRGCTRNCNFCCSTSFWKRDGVYRWRGRSPKLVADELASVKNTYGINRFWFIDNSFEDPGGDSYRRMWDIANEIIKRNINIAYEIYLRGEFHRKATKELIQALKESGLISVAIGTEAGNLNDQKIYGKLATVEDNVKCIKLFRDFGIHVDIGFINLNPYSTLDSLRENVKFLLDSGYAANFYFISRKVRVYEGANLYKMIKRDNLLLEGRYDDEYKYKFMDPRVGTLSAFLDSYFGVYAAEVDIYATKVQYYVRDFAKQVSYLRHYFGTNNNGEGDRIITLYENKINEILQQLGEKNMKWFNEIIDLAEQDWDTEKARAIINSYINKDYIREIGQELDSNRFRMFIKLEKIGADYHQYLNI